MEIQTTAASRADSVHTLLRRRGQPLDVFFTPETVAVIGATNTPGSVGRTVLWNLISHPFGGTVFPINPRHHSVLGIQAYPRIADLPAPVDLAVVVTPAPLVPGIIGECADAGVRGALIISAGFKETGAAGAELERQVLKEARRGNMRLIGPNCLGVMQPLNGVNATFANEVARPGNVGFISQSGALCTAVLDWSARENVGFSAFVSVGSMLDVGWGDLIDYLGDDPQTQSIVIYMESIGDARSFLSAAREVALTKPIIVLKTGRTAAAAQAAASHTGALVGSDAVLDAAFRRSGVLRVDSIADLFDMAEVLAKQPRPLGPQLAILTNAGGPGVLATDALVRDGGRLAELAPTTIEALNQLLPAHWSHHNPVDILGDADPERYAKAVDIVARDPNNDGLLVILTPQAMTCPAEVAKRITPIAQRAGKPLLASWMGGGDVAEGEAMLNCANIPTYAYPDTAARAFQYMWRYSENLHSLYETPIHLLEDTIGAPDRALAARVIQAVRDEGRTLLTEAESKQLLGAYGIPTVETHTAVGEADAVKCAEALGYPVVLKLWSTTITHKTDVDGVRLGLRTATEVRRAYRAIKVAVEQRVGANHFLGVSVQPMISSDGYELILGSSLDPQFGPVLLFGSGGQLVEVLEDRALALPPLTTTLARHMIERTHICKALAGIRGRKPVDLAALEEVLVRFSQLVAEQRSLAEIDINPLLASADRLIALDARVVLHGADVAESSLPRLAIRPYPAEYVGAWALNDGTPVTIRPIRPEDEPLIVAFHHTLSEESVYLRYFSALGLSQRVAHERLIRICFTDYDREIALVAERHDQASGAHEIIAVGRLIKSHSSGTAEFALLVNDRFQCRGLGTELLRRVLDVGRAEDIRRIVAEILPENTRMLRICQRLGFQLKRSIDQPVKVEIEL